MVSFVSALQYTQVFLFLFIFFLLGESSASASASDLPSFLSGAEITGEYLQLPFVLGSRSQAYPEECLLIDPTSQSLTTIFQDAKIKEVV